jgi:transposase
MRTVTLTDEQWQKILPFLRTCSNIYIGQEDECRQFVEAILWVARSGAQWRLLPDAYGNWNSIYKRFSRWSSRGVFEQFFEFCAQDRDLEYLMIDSTIIRAHPCAAGARKKVAARRRKP